MNNRRIQVWSQGGRASWTLAWTFYRAHSCSGSHSKLATFHLTLYVYWESIHRGVYKFSLKAKEVSQSLYFLPHDGMQKIQVLISDSMVAVKYATQISFKRPCCRKHESLRYCIFGSTRPAFNWGHASLQLLPAFENLVINQCHPFPILLPTISFYRYHIIMEDHRCSLPSPVSSSLFHRYFSQYIFCTYNSILVFASQSTQTDMVEIFKYVSHY